MSCIRPAPRGGGGLTRRVVRWPLLLGVAQAGCAGVAPPAPTPQGHAQVYLDRGQALIARGEMAAAVSALREALRREPDLIQARTSLGLALYGLGDLDAAVEELRATLRRQPDALTARLTLAAALLAKQDRAAAARGPQPGRRAAADRATVEQAFRDYRAALWRDFPGLAANGDDTVGGALLRKGRVREAVPVLIREASALSDPAERLLERLYEQGVEGLLPAHDARILGYFDRAAAEGLDRKSVV